MSACSSSFTSSFSSSAPLRLCASSAPLRAASSQSVCRARTLCQMSDIVRWNVYMSDRMPYKMSESERTEYIYIHYSIRMSNRMLNKLWERVSEYVSVGGGNILYVLVYVCICMYMYVYMYIYMLWTSSPRIGAFILQGLAATVLNWRSAGRKSAASKPCLAH